MIWDAWGMFTGALEQYNDEEETVVVKNEPEPDSEPPPTVWPEQPEWKMEFGGWGVNSEGCDRCGASKFKDMFCRQCGAPNMVKCPNGDKTCLMCAKHPGWVEELAP